MGQKKKRFRITFFRRKRFRRSRWSEKNRQNGGRNYQKKVMRKKLGSGTKASPGRTDVKVQICLQTQTTCRLETDMDDYVAAVTAVMAAYRRTPSGGIVLKRSLGTSSALSSEGTSTTMPTCPLRSTGAYAKHDAASGSTPSNCTTDRALPLSSKYG